MRYSAYVLDSSYAENNGFEYWQCVHLALFNDPQTVLPNDQFLQKEVDYPSDCMYECSHANYSTAVVAGLSSKNFFCTCLPEAYRFRMSDLSDEVCWCNFSLCDKFFLKKIH